MLESIGGPQYQVREGSVPIQEASEEVEIYSIG
jgi:hypothetical protein